MEPLRLVCFLLALFISATKAIPQQTASIATMAAPALITQGPELWCPNGQTAVYTTDCTLGTPMSYCFSQEPPIECSRGFFPSVWHPDHCMEQSSCFPLSEPWITTQCSNGAIPYSTSTMFEGTLAGEESTVIKGKFPVSFSTFSFLFEAKVERAEAYLNVLSSGSRRLLLRYKPMVQHDPTTRLVKLRHLLYAAQLLSTGYDNLCLDQ
ncbi:hypothetical protein PDIDSM_3043 [Penicillium digitatum]|nr:hypothetical protein PDIDSM_3043 [Penicillium digitatum]